MNAEPPEQDRPPEDPEQGLWPFELTVPDFRFLRALRIDPER